MDTRNGLLSPPCSGGVADRTAIHVLTPGADTEQDGLQTSSTDKITRRVRRTPDPPGQSGLGQHRHVQAQQHDQHVPSDHGTRRVLAPQQPCQGLVQPAGPA
jgi:hypothetical protein